jgi:hypothetical protein
MVATRRQHSVNAAGRSWADPLNRQHRRLFTALRRFYPLVARWLIRKNSHIFAAEFMGGL